MPVVELNKKVFEKLVGRKLSLEKLKDRIAYLGTDLKRIRGDVIEVEVFPNRPDMLSEQGFARAFSSFIGANRGLKKYKVRKSKEILIVDKSVRNVRPYTACAIVKNMKFDDEKIREIIQIQEKLHITFGRHRKKVAIGIYPYEKIKTPIRFIARKPDEIRFRPLEYDKELNGRQILSKLSTGREYAHLLEGLSKYPIFIDDNDNILSMPPIINSHLTGKITEQTKDVFIECSGFDLNVLKQCLNILVTAMADMGGEIYSMELRYYDGKVETPNLEPSAMKLDINYVNRLTGLELNEKEIKKYLERMGYEYEKGNVLVPAYRADVIHMMDIVNDIAIAYGYENFKEEIPNISTIGQESDMEIFKRKIANLMTGFRLIETSTYHLGNISDSTKKMEVEVEAVELENPLTADYNTLRNWMIPSLMRVLAENKHNEYPQKIFEIGNVFRKNDKTETRVEEFYRLGFLTCHKDANYTEAKQILDALFRMIGMEYEIDEEEHKSFIPGRCGRTRVKGRKIGYIGEIHPKVLENWKLEVPVSGFEINVSELFELVK